MEIEVDGPARRRRCQRRFNSAEAPAGNGTPGRDDVDQGRGADVRDPHLLTVPDLAHRRSRRLPHARSFATRRFPPTSLRRSSSKSRRTRGGSGPLRAYDAPMRINANSNSPSPARFCGRRLLIGRAVSALLAERRLRAGRGCRLCYEKAVDHGWSKEGAPTTPTRTEVAQEAAA